MINFLLLTTSILLSILTWQVAEAQQTAPDPRFQSLTNMYLQQLNAQVACGADNITLQAKIKELEEKLAAQAKSADKPN